MQGWGSQTDILWKLRVCLGSFIGLLGFEALLCVILAKDGSVPQFPLL